MSIINLEDMYYKNLSFDKLNEKLKEILGNYSEEELLDFLLNKIKESKYIKLEILLSICMLSNNFIQKNAQKIVCSLSQEHLEWIIENLSDKLHPSMQREYIVSKLNNFKNLNLEEDFEEEIFSELEYIFSIHKTKLDIFYICSDIQQIFADILVYLSENNNFVSSNEHVIDYIMSHIFIPQDDFWQKAFYDILIHSSDKEQETPKIVTSLLVHTDIFNQETIGKLIDYFNNTHTITHKDIFIIDKLFSQLQSHNEKHLNLKHINNLCSNTLFSSYRYYQNIKKWIEFLNCLEKNSINIQDYAEKFCLTLWDYFNYEFNNNRINVGEKQLVTTSFSYYLSKINNDELKNKVSNFVDSYMDVFLLDKEKVYDRKMTSSQFMIITDFLSNLVDFSVREDDKEQFLTYFIMNSQNHTSIELVINKLKQFPNAYKIASQKIEQIMKSNEFSDNNLICKLIQYLKINENSKLLSLLTEHPDKSVRYVAVNKILKGI